MSKFQTPCVVCKDLIYVPANADPEKAVCVSCKRQGKAPKKESLGRCSKCNIKLTKSRISTKPKMCAFCFAKAVKAEQDEQARREQEAKREAVVPVAVYGADDDMLVPDTALFGGFPWHHANVNPVG